MRSEEEVLELRRRLARWWQATCDVFTLENAVHDEPYEPQPLPWDIIAFVCSTLGSISAGASFDFVSDQKRAAWFPIMLVGGIALVLFGLFALSLDRKNRQIDARKAGAAIERKNRIDEFRRRYSARADFYYDDLDTAGNFTLQALRDAVPWRLRSNQELSDAIFLLQDERHPPILPFNWQHNELYDFLYLAHAKGVDLLAGAGDFHYKSWTESRTMGVREEQPEDPFFINPDEEIL